MRAEKNLLLTDLKSKIEGANAFYITRNLGVNPNQDAGFRTELMKLGGEYEVVRKRIFLKAAIEAGIKLDESFLEGHIGVVFAKEEIPTAKAVFVFANGSDEKLAVVGGFFDGKVCTGKEIKVISELPTRDEMRAQFLSVLEAPMAQLLAVFEAKVEDEASKGNQVQQENT